jgi:hypothetical protein
MLGFLRRLLNGADNRHEQYRAERGATVYGAAIGPKPTRDSHADFEEPADRSGSLAEAELPVDSRHQAMEREERRRHGYGDAPLR